MKMLCSCFVWSFFLGLLVIFEVTPIGKSQNTQDTGIPDKVSNLVYEKTLLKDLTPMTEMSERTELEREYPSLVESPKNADIQNIPKTSEIFNIVNTKNKNYSVKSETLRDEQSSTDDTQMTTLDISEEKFHIAVGSGTVFSGGRFNETMEILNFSSFSSSSPLSHSGFTVGHGSLTASNSIGCPHEVDCSGLDNSRYKGIMLLPLMFDTFPAFFNHAENGCNGGMQLIAIETHKEQTQLVNCTFCSDLTSFGPLQKAHILTSGVVDISSITDDMEPLEALSFGIWSYSGYAIEPTLIAPCQVLLMNPSTGEEEDPAVLVPPGVYSVILIGTMASVCDDGGCTYWKWGLISHDAKQAAFKNVGLGACESPDEPTTPITTQDSTTISTTTQDSTPISTTTPTSTMTTTRHNDLTTTRHDDLTTDEASTGHPKPKDCCPLDKTESSWVCPYEKKMRSCPKDDYVGWQMVTCGPRRKLIVLEDRCLKQWIIDIKDKIADGNASAVEIASEVKLSTNFNVSLTPNDLETLIWVLDNLTSLADHQVEELDDVDERESFLYDYDDDFVHITSNILSVPLTWESLDKEEAGRLGDTLLGNLEDSGFLLAYQLNDTTYGFTSTQVNMTVSAKPRSETHGIELFIPGRESQSFLHLPQDFESLLEGNETHVRLVAFVMEQRAASRALPASLNREANTYKEMNSAMFSATLGRSGHQINFTQLGDHVTIRFSHSYLEAGPIFRDLYRDRRPGEVPTPVPSTAACVYWDTENSTWSSNGCRVINTTSDVTYCSCQHLTMIAIITDIHNYIGRDHVLDVLGTVLSSVSCFSLLIAFVIFHFYKSIASPRVTITKQLCFALGVSQFLLLLLLDRDFLKLSETACSISAMVLHYWLSASLFWMLAEGLHLFQTVSDVLSHISYMPIYWMLGYGVPAILVVTTVLVSYGLSQWSSQEAYAPPYSEYCWLTTEDGYIWAFTGPLIIVIVLNTVSMIFTLRSAATLRTNRQKTLPEQIRLWVKGSFSLNCVLGITWVFGFLYINTAHVFAYIFTIFNASQGTMILLLHCMVNDTVRRAIINSFPDWLSRYFEEKKNTTSVRTINVGSRSSSAPVRSLVRNVNKVVMVTPNSTPPSYPQQRRNKAPTPSDINSPRPRRNVRHGSQLSNATQMTFVMDSSNHSSPPTRRTSLESYESSSNGSSSDEISMGHLDFPPYRSGEDSCWTTENPRYIPGFAAIQECEEKSPRPDQSKMFFQ